MNGYLGTSANHCQVGPASHHNSRRKLKLGRNATRHCPVIVVIVGTSIGIVEFDDAGALV